MQKKKKKCMRELEEDEEDIGFGEEGGRNFFYSKNEANKIIAKTQLFKEEGKSKEFCETQYYNKVYKDTNVFINPTHFFADLAQFWWQNADTLRNVGFKTDNILTKPNNLTEFIFMLAVLDLEEKSSSNNQTFIKEKGLGLTIEANSNILFIN